MTINDSFPFLDVLLRCEGAKSFKDIRSHATIIIKSEHDCSPDMQTHGQVQKSSSLTTPHFSNLFLRGFEEFSAALL